MKNIITSLIVLFLFQQFVSAQSNGNDNYAESLPVSIYIIPKTEILKKYNLAIAADSKNSPLFKPKDEFETKAMYEARMKEADSYMELLVEKYKIQYIEKVKSDHRIKQQLLAEKIDKIKNSYQRNNYLWNEYSSQARLSLATYDPESQIFPVNIFGKSYELKVPIAEAKTFKENLSNVKFQFDSQLLEDARSFDFFNFKFVHPSTGSVYVLNEKKPLYTDYVLTSASKSIVGIPQLNVDVKFIEPSGNNILDAGELGKIQLTVKNLGDGPASMVKIKNSTTTKNITFDEQKVITQIFPGQSQTINLTLKASKQLQTDTSDFLISFSEENGFHPAPVEVSFGTQSFIPPKIEFIEAAIDDGNRNSKIENSEIIKVTALIQNKGQGKASDVRAIFRIDNDAIVPINQNLRSQLIGTLQPGESKKVNFDFVVNNDYKGSDKLPIKITLVEEEGIYGTESNLGLQLNQMMMSSTKINVEGRYEGRKEITEASLTSDVDKNIPEVGVKKSNRFALIIGNENYSKFSKDLNSEVDVDFAAQDAKVFSNYVEKTLGVPSENIETYIDATTVQMKRGLEKLVNYAQALKGDAELIVYYAGHGFPDEVTKESYLIPVDVTGTRLKEGVSLKELYRDLTKYPSKKVTVFLDACFSGGGRSEGLLASRGIKIKPKEEEIKGNLVVFSASTGEQTSLPFKKNSHGMFTYFLMKKLQESKGDVNYSDLHDYLEREVRVNSLKFNNKVQHPQVQFSSTIATKWGEWNFK